jgi:hypothetical protein
VLALPLGWRGLCLIWHLIETCRECLDSRVLLECRVCAFVFARVLLYVFLVSMSSRSPPPPKGRHVFKEFVNVSWGFALVSELTSVVLWV